MKRKLVSEFDPENERISHRSWGQAIKRCEYVKYDETETKQFINYITLFTVFLVHFMSSCLLRRYFAIKIYFCFYQFFLSI